MSLFFDRVILNELGVKGGPNVDDDEEKEKDTPPEDEEETDGPPEDDENTDGPPEDDTEETDGPPEDDEDDGPPEDTDEVPDDNPPEDNENNDGPPEDDEEDGLPEDDTPQGGNDNPPQNNDAPPEDDDTPPDDDSEDGEDDEDDDSTDDGDMKDFDDDKEQTLSDIEDSIFSSLSDQQKAIKVTELKGSFVEIFKACDDIIEKVNLIPKDNSNIEVFENVVNTLIDLKTYVEYYITKTFDTRSYLENEVTLQKYTTILNAVKDVLKQTSKRK